MSIIPGVVRERPLRDDSSSSVSFINFVSKLIISNISTKVKTKFAKKYYSTSEKYLLGTI